MAAGRSIAGTRALIYPVVALLALFTIGVRIGWFREASVAAQTNLVTLTGQTAEQQPIWVTLDRRGEIQSLQTELIGVCDNGRTYQVGWAPASPRVEFAPTRAGVVAEESRSARSSSGVRSTIVVWMYAHPHARSGEGDISYTAVFRYPDGRLLRCASHFIHWTAARGGSRRSGGSGSLSLGAWSGYVWRGATRSVAASWAVPELRSRSSPGAAYTWIGSEGPAAHPVVVDGGGFVPQRAFELVRAALRYPFIQVGTTEVRAAAPNGRVDDGYFAFWADSRRDLVPLWLFAVSPGDQISARMSLAHGRWSISILDGTSGKHRAFSTADEAGATFSDAQWFQENPSSQPFGTDEFMYPQLTPLQMRQLAVNSAPPRTGDLEASWMSEDGGYMAPTAAVADSFWVRAAALTPAGRRYLEIVTRENAAIAAALAGSSVSTASSPLSPPGRRRLVAALSASAASLHASSWPIAVAPQVDRLVAQTRALVAQTLATGAVPLSGSEPLGSAWLSADRAMVQTSHAIRRALGLPDLDFAG